MGGASASALDVVAPASGRLAIVFLRAGEQATTSTPSITADMLVNGVPAAAGRQCATPSCEIDYSSASTGWTAFATIVTEPVVLELSVEPDDFSSTFFFVLSFSTVFSC